MGKEMEKAKNMNMKGDIYMEKNGMEKTTNMILEIN